MQIRRRQFLQLKHLREVEIKRFVLVVTIGYLLTMVYVVFPETVYLTTKKWVPLLIVDHQMPVVYLQVWIDYAMWRVFFCMILFEVWRMFPQYGAYLQAVFFLFVGYVVDYFLTFNNPLIYLTLHGFSFTKPEWPLPYIPFGYSLFMLGCLFYLFNRVSKLVVWK